MHPNQTTTEHFARHPSRVVRHALAIATEAHAGQVRRYTHEPFVTHPITVAHTVASFHSDPLVLPPPCSTT